MKIIKLNTNKTQTPPEFDFKAFSIELGELSEHYGIKLVSLGAVNGLNSGANGMNYLAVWSSDVDAE